MPDVPAVAALGVDDMATDKTTTSVMETSPLPTSDPVAWTERIVATLHAERDGVRDLLAAQQTRLERAETTLEQLFDRLEEVVESGTTEAVESAAVPAGAGAAVGDGAGAADLQRRYEMALDDLRELRAANAELQQQAAKAQSNGSTTVAENRPTVAPLNWEAQKLRILAALESDLDENNSEQRAERLSIEDVLRTTERVLAERDKEIQNLKRRLEESAASAATPPDVTAAVDHAFAGDAVVQAERDRLRQLQDECRDKLRQAEIEISLERAKLARQRVEMEEQLRAAAKNASDGSAALGAADNAGRPARSRWMSRLGLTDADRERRRRS